MDRPATRILVAVWRGASKASFFARYASQYSLHCEGNLLISASEHLRAYSSKRESIP